MRYRIEATQHITFGACVWGLPRVAVPVSAGCVVSADKLELSDVDGGCLFVSSPVFIEGVNGEVTMCEYRVPSDPYHEQRLSNEGREAFVVFAEGVGVEDLPLPAS